MRSRRSKRSLTRTAKRHKRSLGMETLENRQLLTVMINEVLTSNGSDLSTRIRDSAASPFVSLPITPDWIELHNTSGASQDLSDYHLTDSKDRPTRWGFPAGTSIPGNGHLVVFASGENITDPALDENGSLHTSFEISSGDYLALTDPAGTVVDRIDIPNMHRNVSYGFDPLANGGYYVDTTPGAANSNQIQFVADTTFDHDRGLYDAPFDVTISSATEGATIIYTLDGSKPTVDGNNQVTNGTVYSNPISITTTTNLRAMAVKDGMAPTNTDAQSYIFPEHVLQQSDSDIPPSSSWGSSGPDWEMDPEVVNLPDGDPNKPTVDDFSAIPTVSISWNWDELFGSQGIYRVGEHIQKEISFEYIDPMTGNSTQQTASIEIQGGSSVSVPRNWKTDKISMLLRFQDPFGPTKLDFDIFGEGATTVFDQMTIDGQLNFVWDYGSNNTQRSQALYIHDQVAADVQNVISGEGSAPHGRFVHLYHNGVYWGMHYLHERPDESFGAEYYGGDKEEYHALNQNRTISQAINPDGSPTPANAARNDLDAAVALAEDAGNGGLAEWNAVNEQIDVEHFIDYLMMNWYLGNQDWGADNKNWYATRKNTPDGRWRFHSWDAEKVFQDFASGGFDKVGLSPKGLHQDLRGNEEYEILFADRIQALMFNGGILTEEGLIPIFQARVDEVESASRMESARWGDNRVSNPYMREDLMDNFQSVYENFFPDRHERVLEDLIDEGVYPEISAPVFQINGTDQHGGPISVGDTLSMTASAAIITTDTVLIERDADVKAFVPADDSLETGATPWFDPGFDDAGWISGSGVVGFGADFVARVGLNVQNEWNASQSSVYVRYEFDLDAGFNAADIERLNLDIKIDDGYVLYVNGQEFHSDGAPASAGWDSRATSNESNFVHKLVDRYESVDLANAISALQPGNNVLAIRGLAHADDLGHMLIGAGLTMSDDVGVDAPMVYTLDGTDPRFMGGANVGITYDGTIPLNGSTQVKARAFVNGEWSALSSATFAVPSTPGDVLITEINYNPHQPTDAETLARTDVNNDDFEFIEVFNSNPGESVNLLGMQIANGVDFVFPEFELQPNSYAVIVEDMAAFQLRYGTSIDVIGQWSGGLSNNGETIELIDGHGNSLSQVAYQDNSPWSERADGIGATLELIDPAALDTSDNTDKYYRWQASSNLGGTPGDAETSPFGVVINEVRASSDELAGEVDAIELYNNSDAAKDISGWFLSDTSLDFDKFEIPAGTVIPAGSYLTFTEADFNPVGGNGFALRSAGDDVWLVSMTGAGAIDTFADDVHFGATANSETLGRVPNGDGRLAPLVTSSLGAENGAARVGPIVMTEINYNPGDPSEAAKTVDPNVVSDDLEFVEIHNPTASAVDLTNWRIRGGVDLDFVDATMLAAGETVVVVSFNVDNPDNANRVSAFRAHYGIDTSIRLIGGYGGQLNNDSERVQLQRPGIPPVDEPDLTPRLYEDEVLYDDLAPWPTAADGTGVSLQRNSTSDFGNFATSWRADNPTPGSVDTDSPNGDLNGDSLVDDADIDFLCGALGGPFSPSLDFDGSGALGYGDVESFVQDTLGTRIGDTNLDQAINAADLNAVGLHWLQDSNVGWASGDFTCDGQVNAADLNQIGLAWQFVAAPQAARVPRAPLAAAAAIAAVEPARAVDHVIQSLPSTSIGSVGELNGFDSDSDRLNQRQRDFRAGRRFRASVAASPDSRVTSDTDEVKIMDEIFAKLDF